MTEGIYYGIVVPILTVGIASGFVITVSEINSFLIRNLVKRAAARIESDTVVYRTFFRRILVTLAELILPDPVITKVEP